MKYKKFVMHQKLIFLFHRKAKLFVFETWLYFCRYVEKVFHLDMKMLILHRKVFNIDKSKLMLHRKVISCTKKLLIFSRMVRHNSMLLKGWFYNVFKIFVKLNFSLNGLVLLLFTWSKWNSTDFLPRTI